MKKIITLLIIILCFAGFQNLARAELLDRIVAVVNDEPITQSELDILLRPIYDEYKMEFRGEELVTQLNEVRQKLLSQLIEDRLVFQKAKELGIEADAMTIDQKINTFQERFGNAIEMEDALRSQGISLREIRERFERQAVIKTLHSREVYSKVVVSPIEVEEYYRVNASKFSTESRIKVRSITIKKSYEAREKGLVDDDARNKLVGIREAVIKGENFEELAKTNSEDVQAADGGLSDWIHQGTMIPAINDVIFSLKTGEVSPIIETPMGHHIFRVEQREPGKQRTLDEVREEIQRKLFQDKSDELFFNWMQDLKRQAYISVR